MATKPADSVRPIRIFVSSPGDVQKERDAARAVVERLRKDPNFRNHLSLDPILWDDPEARAVMLASLTPQVGTPLERPRKTDGGQYLSGTDWEYEDACRDADADDRKLLVYRCTRDPQVSLRDPTFSEKKQQLDRVDEFFQRFEGSDGGFVGSCASYESVEDFEKLLEMNLRAVLQGFIHTPELGTA